MRLTHVLPIASLLLLVGFMLHAQMVPTATASGPAQRWRYLSIETDGNYAVTESFYVASSAGRHVTTLLKAPGGNDPNADAETEAAFARAIAQAGLDGWEMVSVIRGTVQDAVYPNSIYFKRPL